MRALIAATLVMLANPAFSQAPVDGADYVTIAAQPTNVGDAMAGATSYRKSGAYEAGLETVDGMAIDWLRSRTRSATKPALVLDIDETALSNWKIITRDDFIPHPRDAAIACAVRGWEARSTIWPTWRTSQSTSLTEA